MISSISQVFGQLRQHVSVLVVGYGGNDGGGPLLWVARLENAAAHEYALGAQLHHQRGVGGSGDAAGSEVHHGQAAAAMHFQ